MSENNTPDTNTGASMIEAHLQRWWQLVSDYLTSFDLKAMSPLRIATHLALVLVIIGVLMVTQMQPPDLQISDAALLPDADALAAAPATPETKIQLTAYGGPNIKASGPLVRSAVPFTTIPKRQRNDILSYVVQPGDTVFGIADKFNIRPETIMWSNPELEKNPDLLRIGDKLVILPVNGVYHLVKKGDTLEKIAKKYKVKVEDIVNYSWNQLESADAQLTPGAHLIVPGGKKPYVARTVSVYRGKVPNTAKRGTGAFIWPASGTITQGYWHSHRAIDIASWIGNKVVASDSGYVIFAGWDRTGYGNLIIIDHGNGYRTYYAHLSAIFVRVGDSVARGTRIGSVGSTGHSTGPHLHFEIRYRGVQRNPLGFLP